MRYKHSVPPYLGYSFAEDISLPSPARSGTIELKKFVVTDAEEAFCRQRRDEEEWTRTRTRSSSALAGPTSTLACRTRLHADTAQGREDVAEALAMFVEDDVVETFEQDGTVYYRLAE